MSENTRAICWNCRRAFDCLQATAVGIATCGAFDERPKPPGPARAPSKELADLLWLNTPESLHPKPWTSTDAKSQEIADLRAKLAAAEERAEETERLRKEQAERTHNIVERWDEDKAFLSASQGEIRKLIEWRREAERERDAARADLKRLAQELAVDHSAALKTLIGERDEANERAEKLEIELRTDVADLSTGLGAMTDERDQLKRERDEQIERVEKLEVAYRGLADWCERKLEYTSDSRIAELIAYANRFVGQ